MPHSSNRHYILSIVMLGCLFFVFGLVSWVNSILIPYFKLACELRTEFQSYLVTFAFYIAYLLMTVPAGLFLGRVGFKKGAMVGLWILAAGALLFWPAALTRQFWVFLVALFTMGTALAVLQTVANPFVTIIGPLDTTARRMSIMGICNKSAGILSPIIFSAAVIRPQDKVTMAAVSAGELVGEAKELALNDMVRGMIVPYVILALVLFVFGIVFYRSSIPDLNPNRDNRPAETVTDRKSVLSYPYLVLGIIALFCHVGSQQISISTIINYAQSMGRDFSAASLFPSYTLACIMFGYVLGVLLIPKVISQKQSLVICTVLGLVLSLLVVLTPESRSIWFLVLLGIPNSLIYAGIWPLAIRNLGRWTSLGSSLLVMALCGNAVLSLLYGAAADAGTLHGAYWLLIPCFVYMLYYAIWGCKIEYWNKI